MIKQPAGQKVSVTMLRRAGYKVTYGELLGAEPMIGFIRHVPGHEEGAGMAYRTSGQLELLTDSPGTGCIARLNNPTLFDWNEDGVICEGGGF